MRRDRPERIERHGTKCHDQRGVNNLERAAQKLRTVSQLSLAGFPIGSGLRSRITQRGAGDEDVLATQTNRSEKAIEVLP